MRGWAAAHADALAIGFICCVALAYLWPAFISGPSFGPTDLGRGLSVLTSVANNHIHNNINGDVIDQSVAWNTLNWHLVHHGEFPLWNVLSGNGLPEFLNFESAVLALPSLVGYLVPLSVSFTVEVAIKLLLAGLGTYWCARLLRLSPLSSTFAAVSFMVSGSFANWLGWSISGVFCWTGFICAGAVLCWRSRRWVGPVALVAVSVAFAIYGGFPEGYVLLGGALVGLGAIFVVVRALQGARTSWRPLARLGAGGALGLGLSAPLWLPGISILRQSIRAGTDAAAGIPAHGILLALAQGYDGLPLSGSQFFLTRSNYFESAAYLGVVTIVLALVALVAAPRRPVVVALAVTTLGALAVIYQPGSHDPVQQLIRDVGLGSVATHRLLSAVAFFCALLAGIGLDEVLAFSFARRTVVAFGASTGLVGLAVAYLWTTVDAASASGCTLGSLACSTIRRQSLVGPTLLVALMVVIAGVLTIGRIARRAGVDVNADVDADVNINAGVDGEVGIAGAGARGPLAGRPGSASRVVGGRVGIGRSVPWLAGMALLAESAYLVLSGAPINTYAASPYPESGATSTLAHLVGHRLVAQDGGNASCAGVPIPCGVRRPTGVDFYPNINLGYGIDELGLHDPVIPKRTFADWPVPNSGQLDATTNLFNPDVNTVALARDYGVSYLLVPAGTPPPAGTTRVGVLSNNGITIDVERVTTSAIATASGALRVTSTSRPGDRTLLVRLAGRGPGVVTVHVTDSPGWHATFGGRTVALGRGPTNDLVATIAPGARPASAVLRLSYLPRGLELGAALAVLSALALALGGAQSLLRRRATARRRGELVA